jgi:hypothetical protein
MLQLPYQCRTTHSARSLLLLLPSRRVAVTAAAAAAAAARLPIPCCCCCCCCQWLAPEKLRGCGAILLNSSGQRFVDELTTRDKVTDAIMQQVRTYAAAVHWVSAASAFDSMHAAVGCHSVMWLTLL